jgi:hypothetical protein
MIPKAHPGSIVHGVLWRISSRDLALNVYEAVDRGQYVRRQPTYSRAAGGGPLVYAAARAEAFAARLSGCGRNGRARLQRPEPVSAPCGMAAGAEAVRS